MIKENNKGGKPVQDPYKGKLPLPSISFIYHSFLFLSFTSPTDQINLQSHVWWESLHSNQIMVWLKMKGRGSSNLVKTGGPSNIKCYSEAIWAHGAKNMRKSTLI